TDAIEVLPGGTNQDGVGVGEGELVAGQAGGDGREGGKSRAGGALDVVMVVGHGRPGPGQHDPIGGDVVRRQDGRRQERVGLDLVGGGRIGGLVGGGELVEIDKGLIEAGIGEGGGGGGGGGEQGIVLVVAHGAEDLDAGGGVGAGAGPGQLDGGGRGSHAAETGGRHGSGGVGREQPKHGEI